MNNLAGANQDVVRLHRMALDLAGGRTETTERAFGRRRWLLNGRHLTMVNRQYGAFVVVDGARVLANVAGIVDSAGKFAEVSMFDGFETAQTDFGRFGDLLKRNATVSANRGEPEDGLFVVHQYLNRRFATPSRRKIVFKATL